MRQSIAAGLRDMGFQEIVLTSNGLEAMHMLRTRPFAAVLSDRNIPGMSALALLHWIRGEAALSALPFMLIATDADNECVQMAFEAGATACILRPYTVRDLAGKMRQILAPETPQSPLDGKIGDRLIGAVHPADAGEHKSNGSRILIVDDVPLNVAVIAATLKSEYATEGASSGPQALEIARSARPPDLILLDVMMPGMDGYEVCRRLKADPATRDIPVIFLTNSDDIKDVVSGLDVGAVDYIAKPAEASILKARIRTHLRLKLALSDLAQKYAALAASEQALRAGVAPTAQAD